MRKVIFVSIFAVLLLSFSVLSFTPSVDAKKSTGTYNSIISSDQVCGDRLCAEPLSILEKIKLFLDGPSNSTSLRPQIGGVSQQEVSPDSIDLVIGDEFSDSIDLMYGDEYLEYSETNLSIETAITTDPHTGQKTITVTTTNLDTGEITVEHPVGDTLTHPDGSSIWVSPDDGTVVHTLPDGTVITENPDGTITTTEPDGTTTTIDPYSDYETKDTDEPDKPKGPDEPDKPKGPDDEDDGDPPTELEEIGLEFHGNEKKKSPCPEDMRPQSIELPSSWSILPYAYGQELADDDPCAIVNVSVSDDGTVRTEYSDGTFETVWPDGQIDTMYPDHSFTSEYDGTIILEDPDGNITTINPDGTIDYTTPDGVTTLSDGGIQTTLTEGDGTEIAIETEYPDGTVILEPIIPWDFIKETRYPDGTVETEHLDETFTTEWPDGTIDTIHPDGTFTSEYDGITVFEDLDGNVTTTYPNGDVEVESSDDRVESEYEEGLPLDTLPESYLDDDYISEEFESEESTSMYDSEEFESEESTSMYYSEEFESDEFDEGDYTYQGTSVQESQIEKPPCPENMKKQSIEMPVIWSILPNAYGQEPLIPKDDPCDKVITKSGGTTTITYSNGIIETTDSEGTTRITSKNGSYTVSDLNPNVLSVEVVDGEIITILDNDITIIRQSDGKIVTTSPDDFVIVENPDGTITAGYKFFNSSTQITINPDGSRTASSSEYGTTTTVHKDGRIVTVFEGGYEDGDVETRYTNGTITTEYSDKTSFTIRYDDVTIATDFYGKTTTTYPNGKTIIKDPDENTTVTWNPDTMEETTKYPDKTVTKNLDTGTTFTEFENGKTVFENRDGYSETWYPDDRLEIKWEDETVDIEYPDGKFVTTNPKTGVTATSITDPKTGIITTTQTNGVTITKDPTDNFTRVVFDDDTIIDSYDKDATVITNSDGTTTLHSDEKTVIKYNDKRIETTWKDGKVDVYYPGGLSTSTDPDTGIITTKKLDPETGKFIHSTTNPETGIIAISKYDPKTGKYVTTTKHEIESVIPELSGVGIAKDVTGGSGDTKTGSNTVQSPCPKINKQSLELPVSWSILPKAYGQESPSKDKPCPEGGELKIRAMETRDGSTILVTNDGVTAGFDKNGKPITNPDELDRLRYEALSLWAESRSGYQESLDLEPEPEPEPESTPDSDVESVLPGMSFDLAKAMTGDQFTSPVTESVIPQLAEYDIAKAIAGGGIPDPKPETKKLKPDTKTTIKISEAKSVEQVAKDVFVKPQKVITKETTTEKSKAVKTDTLENTPIEKIDNSFLEKWSEDKKYAPIPTEKITESAENVLSKLAEIFNRFIIVR